ncbi:MAG: cytochrome P450 [Methylococcaceae bacterium]
MVNVTNTILAPGPEAPLTIDIDLESQQAIAKLIKQYGGIVKINDSKRQDLSYIITNPDAIKHILITNHTNYIKGTGFERVKMLLGNGIIVSDGDFWRRQRTMIQPAFSRKNVLQLCEMIKTVTQKLIPQWQLKAETGSSINITEEMSEFALEVILRAILSNDLENIITEQGQNPFSFLATDPTRDLSVAMKFRQLGKLVQKVIDARRVTNKQSGDLLDSLMAAKDKNGNPMSDKELIDEVMTMIIAGHETSAGTLNWVWYELSQNPEADEKAYQEVTSLVHNNSIAIDDLTKLRYTKQCIDEALRLYPPVWLFSRKSIDDDEVLGYSIPAGTNVFLSPYFTHRDPSCWKKPEEFYPEHFTDDGAQLKHKYSFIPFSAGPRRCIGEYFSYVEMQAHLAIMLNLFKLGTLPNQSIEIEPAINLRTKNSIMMQITLR